MLGFTVRGHLGYPGLLESLFAEYILYNQPNPSSYRVNLKCLISSYFYLFALCKVCFMRKQCSLSTGHPLLNPERSAKNP